MTEEEKKDQEQKDEELKDEQLDDVAGGVKASGDNPHIKDMGKNAVTY